VLGDIEGVTRHIPASVGESAECAAIVNPAEENGASYNKALHGKTLFSALYGTYTVTLDEHPSRATNNAGGLLPRSTEAEGARHRQDRQNFKENGSAEQKSARLKYPLQGGRHLKFSPTPSGQRT
jgi:hypothetical protein